MRKLGDPLPVYTIVLLPDGYLLEYRHEYLFLTESKQQHFFYHTLENVVAAVTELERIRKSQGAA